MNVKPTFVFKMSCTQADHLLSINCDGSDFLNGEYCFTDGIFKRWPGFVTLSAFVCVGLLGKIRRLFILEVKSKSAKNWTIFWNPFNQVLSVHRKEPVLFNPIRWCVDEAWGIWKMLKVAQKSLFKWNLLKANCWTFAYTVVASDVFFKFLVNKDSMWNQSINQISCLKN